MPSRYRRDRRQGRTVAFPRTSRRRSCRSVAIGLYIRFVSENDDAATPCDEKWRVRVKSPEWNAWIGLARGACHGTGIDSKWWITERGRTASSLDVFRAPKTHPVSLSLMLRTSLRRVLPMCCFRLSFSPFTYSSKFLPFASLVRYGRANIRKERFPHELVSAIEKFTSYGEQMCQIF